MTINLLRQYQLGNIRRCSDKLRMLSAKFDKLQALAEKEAATDNFVGIVEITGLMILDQVAYAGKVIDILDQLPPN